MVDSGVVLDSVKKMLESGLDEDIIKATLQDIGLKEKEIAEVLRQAKGIAVSQAVSRPEVHEQIAQKTAEKLQDSISQAQELSQMQSAATQTALEEHSSQIEEVSSKVDGLHEKLEFLKEQDELPSSAEISSLQSRIDSLSIDVKELKAGTNALVELLKKVLETDRNVLAQLEGKKK